MNVQVDAEQGNRTKKCDEKLDMIKAERKIQVEWMIN